ncbi:hypothetical protein HK405_004396, partial [Cladochytrium tenue]
MPLTALAPPRAQTLVDDELHDLKLRFELLEGDRKAYYETSQWAIRQNKEEISRLRGQNKDLCDSIARTKKNESSSSARHSMSELERFDHRICEIHKRFDELQAEARAKEERLREMRDQQADLQREAELVRSNLQDSAQAREIRMLENRLDKATIKYNEAQSIRKTYEHIVKQLQDERLTFDNQLAAFERTLKAKRLDSLELEMMSRDANHAKEVAKTELARFEQQINEERKHREKDLHVRKELVKQKMEINEKLDRRTLQVDDPNTDVNLAADKGGDHFDEAKERRLAEYEETMRLVKEATGVSDVREVLAKLQSQDETHQHLQQLRATIEARIAELRDRRAAVLAQLEALRFGGEEHLDRSRRIHDDFVAHVAESQARCRDAGARRDRLAKLLANSVAGIKHLCDKLEVSAK